MVRFMGLTRWLVMLHQTHKPEVIRVDEENCGDCISQGGQVDGDNSKGVAQLRRMRTVRQSISMIPLTKAIGLSHAGWKTTRNCKAYSGKMKEEFDWKPCRFAAAIGACISMKYFSAAKM